MSARPGSPGTPRSPGTPGGIAGSAASAVPGSGGLRTNRRGTLATNSIKISRLVPMLQSIARDFPSWDGWAETLSAEFKKRGTDPRIKYSEFYSDEPAHYFISYFWRSFNLWEIAEGCEYCDLERDESECRTVWIDIFFVVQKKGTSAEHVANWTVKQINLCQEHIVFVHPYIFTRAWCLFEMALGYKIGLNMLVYGQPVESFDQLDNMFEQMEATVPDDVPKIQAEIESIFEYSDETDEFEEAIMHVRDLLAACLLYNQANDLRRNRQLFEAREVFEEAAAMGHRGAEYWLGYFYSLGRAGLPKRRALAVEYYQRAASRGHSAAGGALLEYGRGALPPERDSEALRWHRRGAEQAGDPVAQYWLGEFFETGRGGLVEDREQAVEWYRRAAARGDPDSIEALRRLGDRA